MREAAPRLASYKYKFAIRLPPSWGKARKTREDTRRTERKIKKKEEEEEEWKSKGRSWLKYNRAEWIGLGENMLKPCVWYWINPLSPKLSVTFQRENEISRRASGNLLLICPNLCVTRENCFSVKLMRSNSVREYYTLLLFLRYVDKININVRSIIYLRVTLAFTSDKTRFN